MKNPDFEKPADANKNNVYEVTVVVTDSGRPHRHAGREGGGNERRRRMER